MIEAVDSAESRTQELMIAALRTAGFEVIVPFFPVDAYCQDEVEGLVLGVILDTETTGKDTEKDRVIELGMVFFEYHPDTGVVYRIVDVFNELQDPGMPISPEATEVNGITDEMVAGKVIDVQQVNDRLAYVDIVIAHNAGFDRPLCEREWPIFREKAWACSFKQVQWKAEKLSSAKLEFIAYKRGFHYAAHRAEGDCRALLHVLQAPLGNTGQTTLKDLLDQYHDRDMRIWAIETPFAVKDLLKDRGYRWGDGTCGREKAWYFDVPEETLPSELAWLKANGYNNKNACVVVDVVDQFNRFSTRRAGTKRQYI